MSSFTPKQSPHCLARRGLGAVLASTMLLGGVIATGASAASPALTADDSANTIVGLSAAHMWSSDGGATWSKAAPDTQFKGARTVTVAELDQDALKAVAYDASKVYSAAHTVVSHDGSLWSNSWYVNPGEIPGQNEAWKLVKKLDLTILGEFVFTPWTGAEAEAFQADERAESIAAKKVVGYFPEWGIYEAHDFYGVDDIPLDKITHLNYGFGLLVKDGAGEWSIGVADEWAALQKDGGLYAQVADATERAGVENMLSIGGWTNSENGEFEDATSTPAKTERIAQKMVDFMVEHGFTGLDIDWEYPSDDRGAAQFENLMTEVRSKLTALGQANDEYYPVTIAVTPNHTKMEFIKPEVIVDLVDAVNVMSYDYHGAFDPVTGHNSPLHANAIDTDPKFNIESTMREFHEVHGIPKQQLLVGVPYYGRAWGGVEPTELIEGLPGLGAPGQGTVHGLWDDSGQFTGTNPWYKLKQMEQDPAFTKYWDDEAKVPYLYNASTKEFFTYDDAASVQAKVDFIKRNDYGGAIIWDLSGDTKDQELGTIVGTVLDPSVQPEPLPETEEPQAPVAPTLTVTESIRAVDIAAMMPKDAFTTASRYVVRHNGTYLYEFMEGMSWAGIRSVQGENSKIATSRRAAAVGDVITLESAPGRPGQSTAGSTVIATHTVSDAVEPAPAELTAVTSVTTKGERLTVNVRESVFRSDARIIIAVNGTYQAEVHAGTTYRASTKVADGNAAVSRTVSGLSAGDKVEVRLAPNKPGQSSAGYLTIATHTVK